MSVATTTAIAIATAAGTGAAGVYAAHEQSKSANKAADIQGKTDTAALDEARQKDAESKREFDAQQAFDKAKWDAQQAQYNASEARKAPYRAASAAALQRLASQLGLHFDPTVPAVPAVGGPASAPGAPTSPTDPRFSMYASPDMAVPTSYDATQPGYRPVNPIPPLPQALGLRM